LSPPKKKKRIGTAWLIPTPAPLWRRWHPGGAPAAPVAHQQCLTVVDNAAAITAGKTVPAVAKPRSSSTGGCAVEGGVAVVVDVDHERIECRVEGQNPESGRCGVYLSRQTPTCQKWIQRFRTTWNSAGPAAWTHSGYLVGAYCRSHGGGLYGHQTRLITAEQAWFRSPG
jgi:hypothetical protein